MKVFDNCQRGILLADRLSLEVGIHRVPFDESLLIEPSATFGKHLIHAYLNPSEAPADLSLHGSERGSYHDDFALVRISMPAMLGYPQPYESLNDDKENAKIYAWHLITRQYMALLFCKPAADFIFQMFAIRVALH